MEHPRRRRQIRCPGLRLTGGGGHWGCWGCSRWVTLPGCRQWPKQSNIGLAELASVPRLRQMSPKSPTSPAPACRLGAGSTGRCCHCSLLFPPNLLDAPTIIIQAERSPAVIDRVPLRTGGISGDVQACFLQHLSDGIGNPAPLEFRRCLGL